MSRGAQANEDSETPGTGAGSSGLDVLSRAMASLVGESGESPHDFKRRHHARSGCVGAAEGQWDGCALLDFVALGRGDINSERLGRTCLKRLKVLFLGRQDSCDACRDDACLAPCAEISTDFPDELLESRMSRKNKVGEPRQWDINVSRQWMKCSRRL